MKFLFKKMYFPVNGGYKTLSYIEYDYANIVHTDL
jgi:hypothetical protein